MDSGRHARKRHTVRDREAPGSNPRPPTNPLCARRAKRLDFGRVRIVQ